MSTIFSSFLSRYCETNYRHKRHWRPILDLLECWKNAISRSTLVIKLSSTTYSMSSLTLKVELWTKISISALFVGPIEPKKFDFSYKPIGMPPIPFWGLKESKKGVYIAFLLSAVTISGSKPILKKIFLGYFYPPTLSMQTRTTNVVRNAGCARSRYTLKLSLKFFLIT